MPPANPYVVELRAGKDIRKYEVFAYSPLEAVMQASLQCSATGTTDVALISVGPPERFWVQDGSVGQEIQKAFKRLFDEAIKR